MTGGVSLSAGRCARRATEAGLGCGASWAEAEAGRRAGRAKLGQERDAGLGRAGEKEGSGLGQTLGLGWVLGFLFPTLLLFYF